ncbi:MAG: sulfurtransferase TusA family protein [Candidatus Margulisiibacteriota bacterium]
MLRFYETPAVLVEEQDQFEKDLQEFALGNIDPVKFKAIRVAHGIYEQRQLHTYMVRIRCAASGITPAQLRKTAEMGKLYGNGEVHFTTRQEVQIHEVLLQDIMKVIRGLHTVGLSTRGGGGNTIRNILTSVDSGIAPDESFDVDPYASALTTRLIHEPDSWNLPRKFKIAFSNSEKDTAFTQSTCLGFVATIQNGQKGFMVYCAGGMGAKPMVGHELFGFIPDTQVYHVTRAIKTMFDKHGNRRNRYANRIKFLWAKLERDEFMRLFREEYDQIKDDASLNLVLEPIPNAPKANITLAPVQASGAEFEQWKSRFVFAQKQPGLFSVHLPLQLGDILFDDANKLCDLLDEIGENTMRCDRSQNIRLRNIPEAYLGNVFTVIKSMKQTLADKAFFVSNMINCTGASTCKLGICLPRGLSDAIRDRVVNSSLNLDAIPELRVNMSGCPNTCGMHHIADLGFFGKVGRKSGDMYPAYNVLAGAEVGTPGQTKYAEKVDEIAAHHIPNFVHDFLEAYIPKKAEFPTYKAFLEAEGKTLIKTLCDKYREVPDFAQDPKFYTDFGAKKRLSLDDLGTAECSAGMFDMIEVDEKAIKTLKKALSAAQNDAEKQDILYKLTFHASRMLLVTRGLDSKDETSAIAVFQKHFVETNLISAEFNDVLTLAKLGLKAELPKHEAIIVKLADEVVELYKNMDDSLRFKPKAGEGTTAVAEMLKKDFRGVACPMNFVKTKLVLETLKSGDKLEILLDDGEPIQNVPNSVKLEGHKVLKQEQDGAHWVVQIEKK